MIVISDTSPIIALYKLNKLDILKKLIKSVRNILSDLEKKDSFWMSEHLKAYIIDKANE